MSLDVQDGGKRYGFLQVYRWTMELDLDPSCYGVLVGLMHNANWTTGKTIVSYETLSDDLGCSEPTIKNHVQHLVDAGAILRHERPGKSALIVILPEETLPPKNEEGPPKNLARTPKESSAHPPANVPTIQENTQDTSQEITNIVVVEDGRNLQWEAIESIFGPPASDSQRGLYGKMVKKVGDTDPDEIVRRANLYMRAFSGAAFTLTAFHKWWDWLGSKAAQASALTPQERRKAIASPDDELRRVREQLEGNE